MYEGYRRRVRRVTRGRIDGGPADRLARVMHKFSSFSYMAQRLRQMDGGQILKCTAITHELFVL